VRELDAEGRPVWVTTKQSEWDAEDRAIIYAILDYRADLCSGCGMSMSESLHDETREKHPRFEANFLVCDGCTALEKKQAEFAKKDEKAEKDKQFVARGARRWLVRLLNK
jgi:hypothetical protein